MAEWQIRHTEARLRGGIYPETFKALSAGKPLRQLPNPGALIFPVHHSGGGEGTVLVKEGQSVRQGTPLIETVSGVLHRASRSGVISSVAPHPTLATGDTPSLCVHLTPDPQIETERCLPIEPSPSADMLVHLAKDAGLIGLGGAGFPSHQKWLGQRHTLLINAAECEPYLTADDTLLRHFADKVVMGADALATAFEIPRVVIGIEDNKPEAQVALQQAVLDLKSTRLFECVVMETKYPSGGERQLIALTLGQEVPSGQRPSDLGIVVHNPGTLAALADALAGLPLIERIVTVTGPSIEQPQNWLAPIGTPVSHLLEISGLLNPDARITLGGPMMGRPIEALAAGITKTTHCLLARPKTGWQASPCIRCGACADACPVDLQPQQLYFALEGHALSLANHEGLSDCILCAACNAVCPASIPLAETFALGRHELKERQQSQARADAARVRFEARTERLERVAEEQAKKREARRQASRDLLAKARLARETSDS